MRISIPTPLRSYTGARRAVEAHGATLAEAFEDLDRRFPGIRFRIVDEQDAIRPHIRVWVNQDPVRSLARPLDDADEVVIFQALSGG